MSAPAEPAVSVLIPCYNKAPYLEATLQSVFAQSSRDWELIVVDDGSTDRSLEVLQGYASRLRAIAQANQGASAARQRALNEARGRYIQYLDADDQLLPDALASRMAALERSGADVAYADWQKLRRGADDVFERGEIVTRTLEEVNPDPEIACFTSFWCPPVALLYTRAIVARIGPWNATLPVIQDARYLLDAALAGARFVHVPGVSALYREDTSDSLSRRSRTAFTLDVFENAEQVQAIWQARGRLTAAQRVALGAVHEFVARASFRENPELFQRALARLRAGAGRRGSWPFVAATLERSFGKRTALAILRVLARPAP